MSLFGSLFSGISGLNAQSRAMGMISDNIANVNTTAYKGVSAQFSNLITRKIGVASHNPGGVRTQAFYNVTGQGLIQGSASPTDLAIEGSGFFVVNKLATGDGEQAYTRAGTFQPDAEGNLRMPGGHYLQGWALDDNGEIADINQLRSVNVSNVAGLAAASTIVEIGANLDAETPVRAGYVVGDMAAGTPGMEPDFTLPVQVFDSLGVPHDITLAFLRTGAANTWSMEIIADPAEVDPIYPNGRLAAGEIAFDGQGQLQNLAITPEVPAVLNAPVEIAWLSGADPSVITFDLGTLGGTDGLSQLAADSQMSFKRQNGSAAGDLIGVSIDPSGFVSATFSNGELRRIYQLPVATFANAGGLDPRSGNLFAQTENSGEVMLRVAGTAGAGAIAPSSLEAANVDLGEEFTKMIVTQRAYSANAKIISTTDQMLDELINVVR